MALGKEGEASQGKLVVVSGGGGDVGVASSSISHVSCSSKW